MTRSYFVTVSFDARAPDGWVERTELALVRGGGTVGWLNVGDRTNGTMLWVKPRATLAEARADLFRGFGDEAFEYGLSVGIQPNRIGRIGPGGPARRKCNCGRGWKESARNPNGHAPDCPRYPKKQVRR